MKTVYATSELELKMNHPGVYAVRKVGPLTWRGLIDTH